MGTVSLEDSVTANVGAVTTPTMDAVVTVDDACAYTISVIALAAFDDTSCTNDHERGSRTHEIGIAPTSMEKNTLASTAGTKPVAIELAILLTGNTAPSAAPNRDET